jgi:O-antigen/teichoic acid export membrane protein
LLDAAWVVSSTAALLGILQIKTIESAILVWAFGGSLGLLLGLVTSPMGLPPFAECFRWWLREGRRLGAFLAAESVLCTVAEGAITFGVVAILGSAALGELKAAEILLAPSMLALSALNLFLIPRLARAGKSATTRDALAASLLAVCLSGLTVVGLIALAPLLGDLLYDDNVVVSPGLVLPLGLRVVLGASAVGAISLLKVQIRGQPIVQARLVTAVISVPSLLLMAHLGGLSWAAWGFTIQAGLFAVLVWVLLRRPQKAS